MRLIRITGKHDQLVGFAAGVEFVNDSAIEIVTMVTRTDGARHCELVLKDDDDDDDEDKGDLGGIVRQYRLTRDGLEAA